MRRHNHQEPAHTSQRNASPLRPLNPNEAAVLVANGAAITADGVPTILKMEQNPIAHLTRRPLDTRHNKPTRMTRINAGPPGDTDHIHPLIILTAAKMRFLSPMPG